MSPHEKLLRYLEKLRLDHGPHIESFRARKIFLDLVEIARLQAHALEQLKHLCHHSIRNIEMYRVISAAQEKAAEVIGGKDEI